MGSSGRCLLEGDGGLGDGLLTTALASARSEERLERPTEHRRT